MVAWIFVCLLLVQWQVLISSYVCVSPPAKSMSQDLPSFRFTYQHHRIERQRQLLQTTQSQSSPFRLFAKKFGAIEELLDRREQLKAEIIKLKALYALRKVHHKELSPKILAFNKFPPALLSKSRKYLKHHIHFRWVQYIKLGLQLADMQRGKSAL